MNSSKYLLSSNHADSIEYSRLQQIYLLKIKSSEYPRSPEIKSSEIKSSSTSFKHVFSNLSMNYSWQSSILNPASFINFYIRKQSSKFKSIKKSKIQTYQTTNEEELKVFEWNHSSMNSRKTRDYRINENNRDFEALNDEKNDDENFITNASALAAAELTPSSRLQKFERLEDSIHQQTKQSNFKEFENDKMTMKSSTSFSYDWQMTNLTKV